ncbi:uncharacterized protein PAC_12094 [Phialocephala subalpina]|uniref:Rhodopsin domain-containing protein n=1 Tax=Phialocephala subalpina TaxID=576137 RepID=A0A1L7XB40_9HELO|nr:uncharacterized protein PAC_12094 [Phialocephala subalpina]
MLSPHVADLGPAVIAATWSENAAGTVLMGMRIYTNAFIIRDGPGTSDLDFCSIILLATIFLTISVEYGLGVHLEDLLALDPELIIRASTASKRKWVLWVLVASNVIVNIIIIPIVWTQCSPTAKIWDNSLEGNCDGRERNKLYGFFQGSKKQNSRTGMQKAIIDNVGAGFGAFLDLTLALYPVIIFWNLQLRLHVKIGLMVPFGFGIVAAVCAIIKTTKLSRLTATSDITFQLANLNIWASAEMWVVFIPTVRPIFVKMFNIVTSSNNRSFATGRGYTAQDDSTNISRAWAYSQNRKDTSKVTTIATKNDSEENILGQEGIMMTRESNHFEGSSLERSRKDQDVWKTRFDDQV